MCQNQSERKPQDSSRSSSKSRNYPRERSTSFPNVNETETYDLSESPNHVDDSISNSIMTVHSIENVPPITYDVQVNGVSITIELDSGSCYRLLNSDH